MAYRFGLPILLTLLLGLFAACGSETEPEPGPDGRVSVVATTSIAASVAREVGGGRIALTVLAGTGVDPHDYELSSDDRKAIDRAQVIVTIGEGIDAFADKAVKGKGDRVVVLTKGLTLREADEGDGHGDGDAHEHDPHVWHDPANVKAMAATLAAALMKVDASGGSAYQANLTRYQSQLDDADRQIRALIDAIPAANRKMVTNHDALGYFIDRYGLTFVGAVLPGLSTEAEPSAKDIAALVDLIKREGVRAVFAESSVDPKVAEQIARDAGVKIVDNLYGDSLGEAGSGAETIPGMLVANAKLISNALK